MKSAPQKQHTGEKMPVKEPSGIKEQRQHLYLSSKADMVIREDSINFLGSENISGCINRIVRNSLEISPASYSYVISGKREYYADVLSRVRIKQLDEKSQAAVIDAAVNALIQADIKELESQRPSYPREKTYKIRLQNDLWKELYETEDWQEKDFYSSRGEYIKALIEDYASRSLYDREEIFFRTLLTTLQSAIMLPKKEARILRIRYQTADSRIFDYHIKPYAITADPARQYHYLIALSCPADFEKKVYEPAAFRISRINEDSIRSYARSFGSGGITKDEGDKLSRILKSKGAQFLRDAEETIKIRLSRKGIELFESQYYLRPASSAIDSISPLPDGSAVYSFRCTRRQIEYYFFKFGKEAVVIEPPEFSKMLQNKYAEAEKAYRGADSMENRKT